MQTRKLGNSDLQITPVGYGAWAVGGSGWEFSWGAQDDADSIAAIHRALELGVNWIDTAAVYGLGHSEEVVARALKEWHGAKPYIFTKCARTWDAARKVGSNHSAASVRKECEDSLRRPAKPISYTSIRCTGRQRQWSLAGGGLDRHGRSAKRRQGPLDRRLEFQRAQIRRAQAIAPVTSNQPPYSVIRRALKRKPCRFACSRE